MFDITLSNHAQKFLNKADNQLYDRITDHIKALAINPFPKESCRIVGRKEKIFRIRVGDYRIQYTVFYEKNEIIITDIDKRSRAYQF